MLNVQELERQWFRYKLKTYVPRILLIIIFVTLGIFILLYILDLDTSSNTTSTTPQTSDSLITTKKEKNIARKSALTSVPVKSSQKEILVDKQEQLTLQPSLDFINSLKYMPQEPINEVKLKSTIQKPLITKEQSLGKIESENTQAIIEGNTQARTQKYIENAIIEKKKSPPNFTINTQEDEADIQAVIQRFRNNKKPALSLFIAKRFYALKKYNKAYNYALETNGINSNIEESWLIAAKALSKLNQKEKAVNLLNKYIDDSKSMQAILLREKIKSGTL